MKLNVLIVGFGMALTTPAYADSQDVGVVNDTSVQDFEDGVSSPPNHKAMFAILDATIDGFEWANAALSNDHEVELYCMPDNLALTEDEEVAIVENYIHEKTPAQSTPLGFVALKAIQFTFPCHNH